MTDDTDDTTTEETATEETPEVDTDEPISLEAARKLRSEAKGLRERAKAAEARVEQLSRALHLAKVAATGKLADPTDLPFQPEHLDNDTTLTAAVEALLEAKPHLRARTVTGDVGQGRHGELTAPQDFSALFR